MAPGYETSDGETCVESVEQLQERVKKECSKKSWLFRGMPKVYDKNNLYPGALRGGSAPQVDEERRAFEDFKRQACRMVEHCPPSDLDWMALARHHGLSVRMLDWTADPLVALWFALNPEGETATAPRIWAFPIQDNDVIQMESGQYIALPAESNEKAVRKGQKALLRDLFSGRGHAGRTLLYVPEPVTTRITAQQGWLMLFPTPTGKPPKPFEENGRYKGELAHWDICPKARDDLNIDLGRLGIDELSLFPDLDHLCKSLNKKLEEGAYRAQRADDRAGNTGGE